MKTMDQPVPAQDEAQDTLAELETRLQSQLQGRARGVRLVRRDGGLVLKGWARSYYVKQLAQHLLMRQTELPIRANDIEVA